MSNNKKDVFTPELIERIEKFDRLIGEEQARYEALPDRDNQDDYARDAEESLKHHEEIAGECGFESLVIGIRWSYRWQNEKDRREWGGVL